jgi:hypothetical protein
MTTLVALRISTGGAKNFNRGDNIFEDFFIGRKKGKVKSLDS